MDADRLLSLLEHPMILGSFRNWIRLLLSSQGVSNRYWWRVISVSLITLLSSPLRLYERLRFSRLVEQTDIDPQPVFIVGHWRTGTTYLHQLMCQDKNFGYVTTFQSLAPGMFLTGDHFLKPWMARISTSLHPTRLIDNVPLLMDAPQEDEFAIANMSPYSFLHAYTLPNQARDLFEKFVFFQGLSETDQQKWRDVFLTILRKATINSSGKPLILKNPANSARIKILLQLFPNARFIHIVRNPYEVYRSTLRVFQTIVPKAQIQAVDFGQIENLVLDVYVKLMQRFLHERNLIPNGQLVEIRFEDLERAPLEQMQLVYDQLGLPGFRFALPKMHEFVSTMSAYQKNEYQVSRKDLIRINESWGFAFKTWGYEEKVY